MSKKILWFIAGVISHEHKAKAAAHGLTIRNASAYSEGDFLEACESVCGDVPAAYRERFQMVRLEEIDESEVDLSRLKIEEIKAILAEKGIAFDPSAKKSELVELLQKPEA